jgi:hypothetical protein
MLRAMPRRRSSGPLARRARPGLLGEMRHHRCDEADQRAGTRRCASPRARLSRSRWRVRGSSRRRLLKPSASMSAATPAIALCKLARRVPCRRPSPASAASPNSATAAGRNASALDSGSRSIRQVALGRAVGQHEPAHRVGAILVDDRRPDRRCSSSTWTSSRRGRHRPVRRARSPPPFEISISSG